MGQQHSKKNLRRGPYTQQDEVFRSRNPQEQTVIDRQKAIIDDLQRQVHTMLRVNRQLSRDIDEYREKIEQLSGEGNSVVIEQGNKKMDAELSKKQLKKIVDGMIADAEVNIGYLPDWVERKIYENVFGLLLALLDNVLETAHVEFLGHRMTFDIAPAPVEKEEGKEKEEE